MDLNRPIAYVENKIEDWIQKSTVRFDRDFRDSADKVWVLKYFSPRYLKTFLQNPLLAISATPGFTWGDGIYVAALQYHYSGMVYGRIGVMGWVAHDDTTRVYDAGQEPGIRLYQEWITYSAYLYRLLTTTIHADHVNRILRNNFRRRFAIDVIVFPPDQHNRAYIAPWRDRWFLISDWSNQNIHAPGQRPTFSKKIQDCEWVAIVGEEFEDTASHIFIRDLIGPHLMPVASMPPNRPDLTPLFHQCYQQNLTRGNNSPTVLFLRP